MPDKPSGLSRFWKEVKRRNVHRTLAIYAGTAYIILEAATIIFPRWGLPDWTIDLVLYLLIIGVVITVIIAWIYDITPKGVQKTKPLEEVAEGDLPTDPRKWKAATYISLVVIVALIVYNVSTSNKAVRAGDIQSLVILPFDNFTGDDDLDYFVSGMHSSLIGDMGRISGLRVISKTSSNMYKKVDMSATDIASELNVDAVVEATVMCLGDSICLQFRLVSTTGEEEQLWIADYIEEKSQILNLYNRVTKQIAYEVMIELTEDEENLLARSRTVNKDAYDAYLRGHAYLDDLSRESLEKALEHLSAAVKKDPNWAPPYVGLAMVWASMAQMGFASPEIAGPKIFENIAKAQELDSDLPELHFTQAIIAVWTEWNWEKGEQEFLKALAINPNDVMSRIYYAHLLMILQRLDESFTQGHLAASLDPLNPLVQALYVPVLMGPLGTEAAYTQAEQAISLDPESFFGNNAMEIAAYQNGNYDQVIEAIKYLVPLEEEILKAINQIYKEQGIEAAYEEVILNMEKNQENTPFAPFDYANRYSQIKQYDKAMDWLEIGFEMHDPNMPYITTKAVDFSPLYDNPRFITIQKSMNLSLPKN